MLRTIPDEIAKERVSQVTRVGQFVDVVPFDELSTLELGCWEKMRASSPHYAPPFFSPVFSRAVHQARGDVHVAVIHHGNRTIGFLPFHRFRGVAVPVGRFFNDAHNVIHYPGADIDWRWLLSEIDCRAYDFHALVADTAKLVEHRGCGTIQSFHANVGQDSEKFLAELGRAHKTVGRQGQKTRKLGREIGPVSMEFDCRDADVLETVIRWKRNQYQRTHILDLFTPDWTRSLVTSLHAIAPSSRGARGLLSVLRAGDQIVACHFGILERSRLHYWFPVYDPEFKIYSPGTGLFVELLRDATGHGVQCIDMGYGEQPYKLRQTDATGSVAFGTFSRSKFHLAYRRAESAMIASIKRMPMKNTIKRMWRKIQPTAGISKLR